MLSTTTLEEAVVSFAFSFLASVVVFDEVTLALLAATGFLSFAICEDDVCVEEGFACWLLAYYWVDVFETDCYCKGIRAAVEVFCYYAPACPGIAPAAFRDVEAVLVGDATFLVGDPIWPFLGDDYVVFTFKGEPGPA